MQTLVAHVVEAGGAQACGGLRGGRDSRRGAPVRAGLRGRRRSKTAEMGLLRRQRRRGYEVGL